MRKQVYELRSEDLASVPVWEFALDEEGEEGQDEATVRPYAVSGDLDPSAGMFVVRARFSLADGTRMDGYLTPPPPSDQTLGVVQPIVITPRGQVTFWCGMIALSEEEMAANYQRLAKASASQVFPMRFESDVPIVGGKVSGEIPGFLVVDDIEAKIVRILK